MPTQVAVVVEVATPGYILVALVSYKEQIDATFAFIRCYFCFITKMYPLIHLKYRTPALMIYNSDVIKASYLFKI